MFAHNIYWCFKELESPRKQFHGDGIRTHAEMHRIRTPLYHDHQAVIKELHIVRAGGRTNRYDITLFSQIFKLTSYCFSTVYFVMKFINKRWLYLMDFTVLEILDHSTDISNMKICIWRNTCSIKIIKI